MKEGFWYSEYEPDLPMPVPNDSPWVGQEGFIKALDRIESRLNALAMGPGGDIYVLSFRGWSQCRVCNCGNGSTQFLLRHWTWPEGLRHYIEVHNVKPSPEFIDLIMQDSRRRAIAK